MRSRSIFKRVISSVLALSLLVLCFAALCMTQITIQAYSDSGDGDRLEIQISGQTKIMTYDAEKHGMPFTVVYRINGVVKGSAADTSVDLREDLIDDDGRWQSDVNRDEYGNVISYTKRLTLADFDIYVATSSNYGRVEKSVLDDHSEMTIMPAPLTITARNQTVVYNGQIQGEGDTVYKDPAQIAEKVSVSGLQGNDYLYSIELDGQGKDIGEHNIVPSSAAIYRDGSPVTDNYEITYVNGRLKILKETPPVPPEPHVHELTLVEAEEATCTEDGNSAYYVCDGCGKWFEDATGLAEITDKSAVIIKALGHKWDSGVVTKAATATKDGIRTYTCLHDSSHTKTEPIPATGRKDSNRSEHTVSPLPDAWVRDEAGWHFRENGVLVKNAWRKLEYNGESYWYLFDENGTMKTGWAEWKGEKYYLNPVSDGWMGRMLTGWQEIDGKRYYFETVPGNNQGRMYRSEGTPDGYYVGADGVWQ